MDDQIHQGARQVFVALLVLAAFMAYVALSGYDAIVYYLNDWCITCIDHRQY